MSYLRDMLFEQLESFIGEAPDPQDALDLIDDVVDALKATHDARPEKQDSPEGVAPNGGNPRIVIVVEGGAVSSVHSTSEAVQVEVFDLDEKEVDPAAWGEYVRERDYLKRVRLAVSASNAGRRSYQATPCLLAGAASRFTSVALSDIRGTATGIPPTTTTRIKSTLSSSPTRFIDGLLGETR